jgi:hypothetical protein
MRSALCTPRFGGDPRAHKRAPAPVGWVPEIVPEPLHARRHSGRRAL